MKSFLYTLLLFIISTMVINAQERETIKPKYPEGKINVKKYLEELEQPIQSFHYDNSFVSNKVALEGSIPIGEASNVWTVINPRVQSLTANTDLNTVLFIHRQNKTNLGGSTSFYRLDVSYDGGESFDIENGPLNPNFQDIEGPSGFARYPNCAIYAPDNDPSNAVVSYIGATNDGNPFQILDDNEYYWDGFTSGSSTLDGENTTQTNWYDPINGPIPYSLVNGSPGDFWSATSLLGPNYLTSHVSFTIPVMYKGTWMGSGIDWEELPLPGDFAQFDDGGSVIATYPEIAFSADGEIGYCFLAGALAEDNENRVYKPLFWMTEDGGENWHGPHTFDLDKIGGYADYFKTVNDGNVEGALTLVADKGYDLVVDKNGNAHLIALLQSKFYSLAEDAFSDYAWPMGGNFVVDLIYDRTENDWSMVWPDSETAGLAQIETYEDVIISPTIASDHRLQASIDETGEKIFVFYGDSEASLSQGNNTHRDLFAWGYDIESNKTTDVRNMTSDNEDWYGKAHFFCIANHTLSKNDGYHIPTVFTEVIDPTVNITPVKFHYYQDAFFNETDFSFDPAVPLTGAERYSGVVPVLGEIEAEAITTNNFEFSLPDADSATMFESGVTWYFGDGSAPVKANPDNEVWHGYLVEDVFTVKVCGDNGDGFVCASKTISTVSDTEAPSIEVEYEGTTYGDGDEIIILDDDGLLEDVLKIIVFDNMDEAPVYEISGNYDPFTSGTYEITITAYDDSDNESFINLTIIVEKTETETSLEEIALSNAITISPNPSDGLILIAVSEEYGFVDIQITDTKGKEIYVLNNFAGQQKLDFSNLAAGVYFLNLNTNSVYVTKRFVIN